MKAMRIPKRTGHHLVLVLNLVCFLLVLWAHPCSAQFDPISFPDTTVGTTSTIKCPTTTVGLCFGASCSTSGTVQSLSGPNAPFAIGKFNLLTSSQFFAGNCEANPVSLPVTVGANQILAFQATFTPSAPGLFSGSVTFSTSGGLATLSLSGSGISPPNTQTSSAFVTRLYQQVLSRNPDSAGLNYWVQQLQQDGAVALTVFGFFLSTEFLNRHTSDDQFLHILYRTFLDREPDPNGFNFLLAELQSGARTRENLLDGFMFAPEFAELADFLPPESRLVGFVTLLYLRILNRNPDPPGIQFFLAQLQQNHALLPTILHFLASPEFQSRQTSNTEFVTLLYRLILRRSPDANGLAYWVGLLTQGTATRNQLVAQFAATPEFQAIQQGLFPSGPPPPPSTFAVSVSLAGSGTGTVTSSPAGINCPGTCTANLPSGGTVILTADVTGGSTFGGWGGDCLGAGTTITCTLTVDVNKSVVATFNPPPASFPDLRGTYSAFGVITENQCLNPNNNGTGGFSGATLQIPSQTGGAFNGTATIVNLVAGGTTRVEAAFNGSVTVAGQLSGTFTYSSSFNSVVLHLGSGAFTGSMTGNVITMGATGRVTVGESCVFTLSLSGTRQ